jgi:Fe2+ transport system protein FeoA
MKLSDLDILYKGTITDIVEGSFASKLFEMGIFPGAKFTIIRKAPLRGPIYLQVETSLIALRRFEADNILVE